MLMRGGRAEQIMVIVSQEVRVLVVEASFAVGLALERRLAGRAVIRRVGGEEVCRDAPRWEAYDVVILCPYLADEHRARVRAALGAVPPPPVLVLLGDQPASEPLELANCLGGVPRAVDDVLRAVAGDD
jgi:hypothetical protein